MTRNPIPASPCGAQRIAQTQSNNPPTSPDGLLKLAERIERKALGSILSALNSPLSNSRGNENREVGLEWLQIAAAVRTLARASQ
jgi:hypothetical protein